MRIAFLIFQVILSLSWTELCHAACDAPANRIFNDSQAQQQCPAACADSGGWDGSWNCPSAYYCTCSCEGPCDYNDEGEPVGPR